MYQPTSNNTTHLCKACVGKVTKTTKKNNNWDCLLQIVPKVPIVPISEVRKKAVFEGRNMKMDL